MSTGDEHDDSSPSQRVKYARTLVVGVASVAAVVSIVLFLRAGTERADVDPAQLGPEEEEPDVREGEVADLREEVSSLRTAVEDLDEQMSAPGSTPSDEDDLARDVARLRQAVERVEAAILDDPDRALQLPLLRRDIDEVRDSLDDSIAALNRDIDRQYDLMKWVVGTLAFGMIGLVVSVVLPARPRESKVRERSRAERRSTRTVG